MMHRFPTLVVAFLCCASLADARAVAAQGARHLHAAAPMQVASTPSLTPAAPTAAPTTRAGHTPVAARDLERGAVLSATDIAWTDSLTARSAASDSVQPGWVARRPFRAGEVLEAPGVSPPDLVTSGDVVNVIYTAPGVAITLRGTAVGSGAKGDEVYVRLDNRRRLRGIVAAANTVRVM